jgi:hypothetical protein
VNILKALILTLILVLMVASPCSAIDIDQVNAELHDSDMTRPITVDNGTQNKGWNNWDTGLLVLEIVDWGQTRDIATRFDDKHSNINGVCYYNYKFTETNPVLGDHPSLILVDTYFPTCIGINAIIGFYASPEFKKYWVIPAIILEGYCVSHNIQMGVSVKF